MNRCLAWDNGLYTGAPACPGYFRWARMNDGVNMGDHTSQNMILWFFLACFLSSISLMGWLLSPFLSIIVLGAVVAGAFYPLYRLFSAHEKISVGFASFLTCLMIFLVLFIPIVFFVGVLAREASELIQLAKGPALSNFITTHFTNSALLERINPLLAAFDFTITGEELNRTISEIGREVGRFLYDQAMAIASNHTGLSRQFFSHAPGYFFSAH